MKLGDVFPSFTDVEGSEILVEGFILQILENGEMITLSILK